MLGFLPGADLDSVVRREIKDLNDTRTGSADRRGAWNWQDDIGAWMAGSNKEEVLRLAKKKADEDLAKKLQPQASAAAANLGPLRALYQGVDGLTAEQAQSLVLQDQSRAKALQTELAAGNIDASVLSPTASAGEIFGAGAKARKTEKRDEVLRLEGRQDDRLAMEMQLNRLDRQDDREARRDQTALANRRLDIQEARGMRRDRQAAIQQMMAGLAQMGASIAI